MQAPNALMTQPTGAAEIRSVVVRGEQENRKICRYIIVYVLKELAREEEEYANGGQSGGTYMLLYIVCL